MTIAPAPVHFGHVLSHPVTGGPLKVTLTSASRAIVRSERRHPNDLLPVVHLDGYGHDYVIGEIILNRDDDAGRWRAQVSCASSIVRGDGVASGALARREILAALEHFVTELATDARLWLAGRNALYRAQAQAYNALQATPDDSDVVANYDRITREIARHLSLAHASTPRTYIAPQG